MSEQDRRREWSTELAYVMIQLPCGDLAWIVQGAFTSQISVLLHSPPLLTICCSWVNTCPLLNGKNVIKFILVRRNM